MIRIRMSDEPPPLHSLTDSPRRKVLPGARDKPTDSPYGLRENSKVPARFREYAEEEITRQNRQSPIKKRTGTTPMKRTITGSAIITTSSGVPLLTQNMVTHHNQMHPAASMTQHTNYTLNTSTSVPSKAVRKLHATPGSQSQHSQSSDNINIMDNPLPPLPHRSQLPVTPQPAAPFQSSVVSTVSIGGRPQPVMISNPNFNRVSHFNRAHRPRVTQTDLTDSLKENLRRLKNVLKLPKARRWVYCEFFYSGVDEQLFLGENEFSQLLRESFPNLKTRSMCRPEWRTIRRLIGKPRRCSQAFLDEERHQLETRRQKIRQIFDGTYLAEGNTDLSDLPTQLPRPLAVGAKIYARVRMPKDGVYAGTIDAILSDAYRVVFDKEEMIHPMVIPDSEVMCDGKLDLLPLTYFLEQNKAQLPPGALKLGPSPILPNGKILADRSSMKHDILMSSHSKVINQKKSGSRDEKVGNFPVRLLVILVKVSKLIELKKGLVKQLTDLNTEAERANLLADSYHFTFQEKYAQVVVDLEQLNKQMSTYMQGIQEYHNQLLPQLNEVSVTARPEALRKISNTHAVQIVKHCNNGLNVTNKRAIDLIVNLTGLLLQVRQLGQQKCTPLDLHTLSESITEIRGHILPQNASAFQDHVEVHMKQIHNMMLQNGSV